MELTTCNFVCADCRKFIKGVDPIWSIRGTLCEKCFSKLADSVVTQGVVISVTKTTAPATGEILCGLFLPPLT